MQKRLGDGAGNGDSSGKDSSGDGLHSPAYTLRQFGVSLRTIVDKVVMTMGIITNMLMIVIAGLAVCVFATTVTSISTTVTGTTCH